MAASQLSLMSGNISGIVAAAPIVSVMVALACRMRALPAALLGVFVAIVGMLICFPLGIPAIIAAVRAMAGTILTVALILLGGVGLSELMIRSGAQGTIADWLLQVSNERALMLLLIVFGITPFMESVTGFGLGVIVAIPLLLRFGLPPAKAAVIALLGLVLVPWGGLGPGTLVASELGGVSFHDLGMMSAWFNLPVILVSMVTVLALAFGRDAVRHLGLALLVVAVLWLSLLLASRYGTPPVAGIIASSCVVSALLLLARFRQGSTPGTSRELLRMALPYAVLTGGLLLSKGLITALQAPAALQCLASPALWLPLTTLLSLWLLRVPAAQWQTHVRATLVNWWPIASSTTAFMLLGVLLAANGMAAELARTAASTGQLFAFLAPALGSLGAYVTGSNTGAAAMFSAATVLASTETGGLGLIVLAGQNVAGSFAIILAPPRIALAAGIAMGAGASLSAGYVRILLVAVAVATLCLGVVASVVINVVG